MKLFYWAALPAALTLIVAPAFRATAIPAEPDYPCYMRTASGVVVNLVAMCAGRPQTVATGSNSTAPAIQLTNREAKFVADYKQLASVEDNRAVAVALTRIIASDPQGEIGIANDICRILSNGVSRSQVLKQERDAIPQDSSTDPLSHAIGEARISILNRLADKTYCAGY